jgi:hypothetical protein
MSYSRQHCLSLQHSLIVAACCLRVALFCLRTSRSSTLDTRLSLLSTVVPLRTTVCPCLTLSASACFSFPGFISTGFPCPWNATTQGENCRTCSILNARQPRPASQPHSFFSHSSPICGPDILRAHEATPLLLFVSQFTGLNTIQCPTDDRCIRYFAFFSPLTIMSTILSP